MRNIIIMDFAAMFREEREKMLREIAGNLGVQIVVCGLVSPEGAGWYRRPITTVEDLKGLRVRMTGLGAQVLDRLGAETVNLTEGGPSVATRKNAATSGQSQTRKRAMISIGGSSTLSCAT